MAEHTKLPWRVEQDTDLIWGACNPDDFTSYGMGYSIVVGTSASYTRGKPSMDERMANAAFIVKACNAHEALVQFAQFIRDGYERGDISHVEYRVQACRAALDVLESVEPAASVPSADRATVGGEK